MRPVNDTAISFSFWCANFAFYHGISNHPDKDHLFTELTVFGENGTTPLSIVSFSGMYFAAFSR
jgi:hypothetical protein